MSNDLGPFSGEHDPLMDQAIKLVTEYRRASISLVQRHLRIGYIRASYMLEAMEKRGLVKANPTPSGSVWVMA
jgi:S-DNA-T family DNA segregation ATPase FtsK/SpoIIIE